MSASASGLSGRSAARDGDGRGFLPGVLGRRFRECEHHERRARGACGASGDACEDDVDENGRGETEPEATDEEGEEPVSGIVAVLDDGPPGSSALSAARSTGGTSFA
ncbi:hypothetical protein [Planomonospora venezuelensis]|uniref:Uncharacterized protein n=1 Tax=Planomonospora venezuelensis TaxID=1999 RepID=A0A841DC88_PLAVE|nr:hypothetical protein [Planomonospora venezuelensis]MBB5966074.1 hypothetical protein [Planomonospora venezuelensis]